MSGMEANINDEDEEEMRRKNEMNMFAAMVHGSFTNDMDDGDDSANLDHSHQTGSVSLVDKCEQQSNDADEEMRRKNEMNMFAAMVHGSFMNDMDDGDDSANLDHSHQTGSVSLVDKCEQQSNDADMEIIGEKDDLVNNEIKELEGEEKRSIDEIKDFAVLTTSGTMKYQSPRDRHNGLDDDLGLEGERGGEDSFNENGTYDYAAEEIRRKNEMSAFAAMANEEIPFFVEEEKEESGISNPNKIGDRQEHGEFQAFVSRGGSMVFDSKHFANTKEKNDDIAFTQGIGIGEGGGGTFVSSTTCSNSKTSNSHQQQNFTAALASLENDRERDLNGVVAPAEKQVLTQSTEMTLPVFSNLQTTQRKPACDQIYSERILVPRPLFFGTVVPGRVCAVLGSSYLSTGNDDHRSGDKNHCDQQQSGATKVGDDQNEEKTKSDEKRKIEIDSACITDEKKLDGNEIEAVKKIESMYDETITKSLGDRKDLKPRYKEQYKNLSNTIEAFGNSSLARCERRSTSGNSDWFKSHVTLIEPVWGDMARLEREDRILERTETVNDESIVCQSEIQHNVSSLASPISERTDISENSEFESAVCSPINDQRIVVGKSPTTREYPVNLPLSPNEGSVSSVSDLNENNLFLQYARGDSQGLGGTFVGAKGTLVSVPESDVLRNMSKPNGSFESSELKRQVGLNDNLSKALESLTDSDGVTGASAVSLGAVEAGEAASEAIQQITETVKDGRPLSNFELTRGKVPLYSCDDNPLPSITDLFVHETKEDLMRSSEQQESEEIISSHTVPNIFGTTVCPSRCSGPDDGHSWFSRTGEEGESSSSPADLDFLATKLHSESIGRSQHKVNMSFDSLPSIRALNKSTLPSPLPPPPMKKVMMRRYSNSSRTFHSSISETINQNVIINDSLSAAASSLPPRFEAFDRKKSPAKRKMRIGWWNVEEASDKKKSENNSCTTTPKKTATLKVPPVKEELRPNDFSANMSPKLNELLESNRPLSALPAAVDTVKQMPSLSDRPPNTRYVQIDTHFVGFRSLGEIEPFFCGISLWHVNTNAAVELDTSPDRNRCGRITETLSFDVVSDPVVEGLCRTSIFPSLYTTKGDHLNTTRCGVFPIPSCFNMNNIYAVIIVEKTLTGEDIDLDIYYNNKPKGEDIAQELLKCRTRAGKAADRLGHFLTPFAFGVAPLVKIIGPKSPVAPSSMAAQIPLLKLRPGEGDSPIIDHIIAMNCPRGHPSVKKTPEVANDGAAVMVLRNFGYLGIHSTMSRSSKLAKDRLVDFTGEVQVRQRQKGENISVPFDDDGRIKLLDPWHHNFIAEPAINGGRVPSTKEDPSIYSRELASIPLATGRISSRSLKELKPSIHFHTSFFNELLLYPRNISNCPKRNVTIRMEIGRLQFCDDLKAMIVKLSDPCIHNTRRGPFLVREVFTSCAYHKVDPAFSNEFKLKLPLGDLSYKEEGDLVAVFTAYHITVKGKKKWALKASKDSEDTYAPLEQIGCGYLRLSSGDKASYLIQNGIHDVQLKYKLRQVGGYTESNLDECGQPDQSHLDPNVRVLEPIVSVTDEIDILNSASSVSETPVGNASLQNNLWSIDNLPDNGESVNENSPDSTYNPPGSTSEKDSTQFDGIWSKAKLFKEQRPKPVSLVESTLHIRSVSLSSVHTQNEALALYFECAPSIPSRLKNNEFGGIWKENCDEIKTKVKHMQETFCMDTSQEQHLLQTILGISKSSLCPPADISAHFIRVIFPLWRVLVAGIGKPSIEFCNPSFSLPLRIHTFSTLLYILNAVTSYLSKSGVAEPGCSQGWSIMTTARIVTILFDEETVLIGGESAFQEDDCSSYYSIGSDVNSESENSSNNQDSKNGGPVDLKRLDFMSPRTVSPERGDMDLEFISVKSNDSKSPSEQLSPSSQDDSILLDRSEKPPPQRKRAFSAPNTNPLKVDTKSDFQFALTAGANSPALSTAAPSAPIRRKWMTGGPLSSLATIAEDHDKIDDKAGKDVGGQHSLLSSISGGSDTLDTELVVNKSKPVKVKQMRVPKLNTVETRDTGRDETNFTELDLNEDANSTGSDSAQSSKSSKTVPNTDEIETAGEAFLDTIGKNYGYGMTHSKVLGGEERRVGVAHHRKTKSRCSIDWTLPPTDHIIESHQQFEIINRSSSLNNKISNLQTEKSTENIDSVEEAASTSSSSERCNSSKSNSEDQSPKHAACGKPTCLPSYLERIIHQGKKEEQGRWFPFVYEVVIFQWNALLSEQTRKSSRKSNISSDVRVNLSEASQKAKGVVISCAPVLFAIIKKSLAYRIDSLFRKPAADSRVNHGAHATFGINPLVTLDDGLLSTMESLITKVTDACIDSRNFDSWTFRSTSIAVNDSIVRFLRDLFALLDARVVHRLILVYFSRFTSREGKKWEEHDSKIGLRCSWEVAKLRLNAITTLIRFQDQIKINKPLTESWGNWSLRPPTRSNRHLFSNAIEELESLGMEAFAAMDPMRKGLIAIPEWKPHWLVELIMDVCIAATGHVEQSIQLRASSLLYELFWTSSNIGKLQGSSTVVASLYLSFIPKLLDHAAFLSSLPAKGPMRKDLLPCFVFVLQSAPFWLLRALWRKFCKRTEGKGTVDTCIYGGIKNLSGIEDESGINKKEDDITESVTENHHDDSENDEKRLPCILDVCSLLNLSLTTMEYEGSESHFDEHMSDNVIYQWHAEFLLSPENKPTATNRHDLRAFWGDAKLSAVTSTSSRKWYCHDGAIVIITTCRNIVREYVSMLRPTGDYDTRFSANGPIASFSIGTGSQSIEKNRTRSKGGKYMIESIDFSFEDKVIFLRAISSIYLNCLSLRQSDVVFIKTLLAATEILKVFGIDCFLSAVGETLQHWMRVLLIHCGARRAKVRVEALDFLALILRLQWDSFGSFTRVRIPLLAVQTEVMERIVATAAARYYREQRKEKITIRYLSNLRAEAALTPLWRTLQRLHDGSASNNAAFKSALQLLANRMKTLYKAYIAAHALAIVNRAKEKIGSQEEVSMDESEFQIARVVMESAEFSKKILGNNHVALKKGPVVIQNEIVEDAFLAAADVFSPTELPLHRVAWLRKLAEFHATRERNAEQAACRLQIYKTLRQAATLHEMLWNSIPFWPWASDPSDGMHVDGEGPAGINSVNDSGIDFDDQNQTAHPLLEAERCESFRRIFYRVANSVKMKTGDWDVGGKKTLFYGACFASEYNTVTSWIALCEIESDMVDEAETAGELFLKAGIVESSRFCWSLATQFYSEVFNYARLAYCYRKLASVVASQVPSIETGHKHTSNHLEFSSPLGRFYRVHYHGGASDELMGKMFIYRAPVYVKLEEFCENLRQVFASILPEKTPISLSLDDGRVLQEPQSRKPQRRQLGAVPREPMIIKVTPLKPLLSKDRCPRGSAEWFYRQTEIAILHEQKKKSVPPTSLSMPRQNHNISRNRFSTISSHANGFGRPSDSNNSFNNNSRTEHEFIGGGEEIGVNKFSFTHDRNRQRAYRELHKIPTEMVAEKNLRVTELLVSKNMPNCVTRQPVAVENRTVFHQAPIEAGVEAVCSYCAILFRTAVATNGLAVIGDRDDQKIGTAAIKVIAECIHRSKVKELGLTMLKKVEIDDSQNMGSYERLSEEETELHRVKLSRAIIIFLELLHVLIGRNRDLLLEANESRKRRDASSTGSYSARGGIQCGIPPSPGNFDGGTFFTDRTYDDGVSTMYGGGSTSSTTDRTDKAMAIQRELQISFIAMTKALQQIIRDVIHSETPRWMRMCAQDSHYFSSGAYRQTRIPIGEELLFFRHPSDMGYHDSNGQDPNESFGIPLSILPTRTNSSEHDSYEESVTSRTHSRASSRDSPSTTNYPNF